MNRRTSLSCLTLTSVLGLAIVRPVHGSELGKEMAEADARLNTVYQQVLRGLPNEKARESIKVAQRTWITWRDAEIAMARALYQNENGKTDLFMNLALTRLRIQQLELIGKRESDYGYPYEE